MQRTPAPHYREKSDELKKEALSIDIGAKTPFLMEAAQRGKIDLRDTEAVKEATFRYLEVCKDTGAYPTVLGLSAAFGVSRQWVNKYMREHPDTPTAEFLEAVKVNFADILLNAVLHRNASEAGGIFAMKNMADFVDKVELIAAPAMPMGDNMDASELQRRIENSVVIDDFDESEDF